jgi:hypothetical protein
MAGESGVIEMKITSDSSQVRSDMEGLAASVNKSTGKLMHDIDGVTTSHNALLRSDHRVAAAMRGLTANAIASGNALTDAGAAMQALAMATNVSLPALIGLEVVGALISKISKAHSDAVKLNEELSKAGKPPEPGAPPPTKEQTAATGKIIAESRASKTFQEHVEGLLNNTFGAFAGLVEKLTGSVGRTVDEAATPLINPDGSVANSGPLQKTRRDKWLSLSLDPRDQDMRIMGSIPIDETRDKSWSKQMGPDDPDALQKKINEDEAERQRILGEKRRADEDARIRLTGRVGKPGDEAMSGLAGESGRLSGVAGKQLEGLQFTLAELAKKGRDTASGDDSQAGAGKLAKRALKEEELAKKEMLAEHYPEAFRHQANADALKNQIVPLRDTEKDYLNAIERAQIYKDQLEAIRNINFKGR